MKQNIDAWLTKAGFPGVVPIETRYFLFYSDLSRRDTMEIAGVLDSMYERVIEMLRLPKGMNLFWGKCGILVCRDAERFQMIESLAFNNNRLAGGYFHAIGPRSFVNIYRDHSGFYEVMVHETVHAIMHRFLSPVSLPTWANEGFAEYIAANSSRGTKVDRMHQSDGIHYIRQRGSVLDIMRMNYADGSWAGPGQVGYAVSYLMIDLMVSQNSAGFVDWIRAVKAGKPWEQALADQFGSDPATTATHRRAVVSIEQLIRAWCDRCSRPCQPVVMVGTRGLSRAGFPEVTQEEEEVIHCDNAVLVEVCVRISRAPG